MLYFTKLKNWLADALFPPTCLNCKKIINKNDGGLCAACFAEIPINKTFFCGVCRARLPNNKKICHKNAPYILAAACDYQNEVVRKLIWQLKYRRKKQAALPLARLITAYLGQLDPIIPVGLICPIPLHPKRERERGFNQSRLIAENLIGQICTINLIRTKNTLPQQKVVDFQKRKENMENSFSLYLPASPRPIRPVGPVCPISPIDSISGKTIFLLDDVFTSGTTITEAAKVLKSAGAKKIIALVVAKT